MFEISLNLLRLYTGAINNKSIPKDELTIRISMKSLLVTEWLDINVIYRNIKHLLSKHIANASAAPHHTFLCHIRRNAIYMQAVARQKNIRNSKSVGRDIKEPKKRDIVEQKHLRPRTREGTFETTWRIEFILERVTFHDATKIKWAAALFKHTMNIEQCFII